MYWSRIFVVASIGLVACSQSSFQGAQHMSPSSDSTERKETEMRRNFRPVKWPLKFETHKFNALCFDTLTCSVWYSGMDHGYKTPTASLSTYGPGYIDTWHAGHGGIENFPDPASVTWVTRDGKKREASIDIASIFRNEVVRHNVPREEIPDLPDGEYPFEPSIILEVNDASIRVYMRAFISTRHLRIPGNVNSDYRNDIILVKSYNY
jgi:hypothetical protein